VQIHKAFKFRVYPNRRQVRQLAHHFGSARWVYNYFLQYKTDYYKEHKKSATFLKMSKILTSLRKEHTWLGATSRQCGGNALRHLDVAFNNFFAKKSKYPSFKSKRSRQSFAVGTPFCQVKARGVHVPLIGVLKCKQIKSLPQEYKLLSITISRTTTGKYFASVAVQLEISDPVVDKSKPTIGIDFGLKHFITTSDKKIIDHLKPRERSHKKLRRAHRRLSRCKKGSKRRLVAKCKLALVYEKTANQRSDFLHKLSREMIDENQDIYLEDLSIKGMSSRFGKQIEDLGWTEFTRQLSYKGVWYGCKVEKIDRFFPSSKTCSECGLVNRNLKLSDRVWKCECGVTHDRDINAAKNILQYGRADRN